MFFRVKPAKGFRYLQIARSVRRGKSVRQEIIATMARLDVLQESGQLDSLLRSGLRHARCSFLAFCLKRELEVRLEEKELQPEWAEMIRGLHNLHQVELELQGSRFFLRSLMIGHASQAVRAVEVALPSVIQEVS